MSAAWLEPQWPAPAGVRALSTFRSGGASAAPYASLNLGGHVGDLAQAVAENRRRLKAAAGLPAEPAWLTQVHGTTVIDLDADQHGGVGQDAAANLAAVAPRERDGISPRADPGRHGQGTRADIVMKSRELAEK